MPRNLLPRRPLCAIGYAVLYTLATLVLYQGALLDYVLAQVDIATGDGLTILALIELLQAVLTLTLMALLGIVSVWAMKLVGAVLFGVNAAAAYYMATYGIVIDPTMIGNILNTNTGEAGGLMHPRLVMWIVGLGVLPGAIALWIPVRRCALKTLGALAASWIVAGGAVWTGSGVWLWFDSHNSAIGPRMLPWSYIGNGLRYAQETRRRNQPPILMPDARLDPLPGNTLVVVVIGEAARADHLEYFGYDRPTNPFTRDLGVVAFPGGRSCTTYTIGSVACILSPQGSRAQVDEPWEPLPAYTARAGIDTVVRLNNSGTPPMPGVDLSEAPELAALCNTAGCPGPLHDALLLNGLAERLTPVAERRLLVLHMNGSHGPEYFTKYPDDFEVFTPTCQTTLVNECDPQAVVNAYDNSLRYSDWVLAQLIALLDDLPDTQVLLLYVSDHGQSLGENGVYLHGLPNAIAPEEQRRIPLLLWMDDDFAAARGIDPANLARPVEDPQDLIFNTVLGALAISGPAYDPDRDLMRPVNQ